MSYQGWDFVEWIKYMKNQGATMPASTGFITSVDPKKFMAKVMLEPFGVETGWIPIGMAYGGTGFGIIALPEVGTEVTVVFEMGDINSGKIVCINFRQPDPPNMPLEVTPGELLLQHKSGSYIKFKNDGSIEIKGQISYK